MERNVLVESKVAKILLVGLKNNKFKLACATISRVESLSKTSTIVGNTLKVKKELTGLADD